MSDPLTNPYAPPESSPAYAALVEPDGSPSNYEGERRSVVILVLLCLVTFGVFPSFWYLRRKRFLDSLAADRRVGALPFVSVALIVALIVFAAVREEPATRLAEGASGLVNVFLAFRVAAILRSDFARTGRFVGISSLGVFFFGCSYLQHVINEAADVPARWSRKKAKRAQDLAP